MSLVTRFVRTVTTTRWSEPAKITIKGTTIIEKHQTKRFSMSIFTTNSRTSFGLNECQIGNLANQKLTNSKFLLKSKQVIPETFKRYFSETTRDISNVNETIETTNESVENKSILELKLVIENKNNMIRQLARRIGDLEFENKELKKNFEKYIEISSSSTEFRNMVDDLLEEFATSLPELSKNQMIEKITDHSKSNNIKICIPIDKNPYYVRIMYHLFFNDCDKCQILRDKIEARGWTYDKFAFVIMYTKIKTIVHEYNQGLTVESMIRGLKAFGMMEYNMPEAVRDMYEAKNS